MNTMPLKSNATVTATTFPLGTQWELDEHNSWNLKFKNPTNNGDDVWVFIETRNSYCDRGHFSYGCMHGIPSDGADSFPRYFMNLDRCMAEAEEWTAWRLWKSDTRDNKAAHARMLQKANDMIERLLGTNVS
jgi:hypothetical protein